MRRRQKTLRKMKLSCIWWKLLQGIIIKSSRVLVYILWCKLRLQSIYCRIKIHTLETPDSCTHEVAVPPSFEFTGLRESVGSK